MKFTKLGILVAVVSAAFVGKSAMANTLTYGGLTVGGAVGSNFLMTIEIDLSATGSVYGGGGDNFSIANFQGVTTLDTTGVTTITTKNVVDTKGNTWTITLSGSTITGTNLGQSNTTYYNGSIAPLLTFGLLDKGNTVQVSNTFGSQDHNFGGAVVNGSTLDTPINGQTDFIPTVPLPNAAWMGFSSLAVLGLIGYARRRAVQA